jgi:hypothetical protein
MYTLGKYVLLKSVMFGSRTWKPGSPNATVQEVVRYDPHAATTISVAMAAASVASSVAAGMSAPSSLPSAPPAAAVVAVAGPMAAQSPAPVPVLGAAATVAVPSPAPAPVVVDKAPPAVAAATAALAGAAALVGAALRHEEVAVSVGVGQSCSNEELAQIGISKITGERDRQIRIDTLTQCHSIGDRQAHRWWRAWSNLQMARCTCCVLHAVGKNLGVFDYQIKFTNTTRDTFGFTDAEGNTYKNTAFRLGSHSVTYSSLADKVQNPTIVKVRAWLMYGTVQYSTV